MTTPNAAVDLPLPWPVLTRTSDRARSDRTTAAIGMRRPWMLTGLAGGIAGTVTVALAPNIGVVLAGWCIAQVFLNALLAAQVAVLADQVPAAQRGVVSGVLGICLPAASVAATYLVQAFDQTDLTMFLAPCAVGALFVVSFTAKLHDRRLDPARKPAWSLRELVGSFYVNPRTSPDFAWAFVSRFMFVMAYAFLVTYQAYYLLDHIGIDEGDVQHQIYIGTLVQSAVLALTSPMAGRLSDRVGRRKAFVATAAGIYAIAMVIVATASGADGYLIGMAISGLGFGMYMAVDLALVVDVLPQTESAAKDLGVLNVAGALPFALAPALAPAVLGEKAEIAPETRQLPRCLLAISAPPNNRVHETLERSEVVRRRKMPKRAVITGEGTICPVGADRKQTCCRRARQGLAAVLRRIAAWFGRSRRDLLPRARRRLDPRVFAAYKSPYT